MLLNDVKEDLRRLCDRRRITYRDLLWWNEQGVKGAYLLLSGKPGIVVNRALVKILEALGYDVQMHYVKKRRMESPGAEGDEGTAAGKRVPEEPGVD